MLRHPGEDRAGMVSTEIARCTEEQTVVEKHDAAVEVLPAVPQVVKDRFAPRAPARGPRKFEDGAATFVTGGRTAEGGSAGQVPL